MATAMTASLTLDERERRRRVLHPRGDGHRDGEDVVDEERAADREPGPRPEVDARHLVVAAARGVGVHVLPVAT